MPLLAEHQAHLFRVKKPWDHRFHRFKKPAGKPVKPAGSLGLKKLGTV
jgi:hypothetical protein